MVAERHYLTRDACRFLEAEYGIKIAPTSLETDRSTGRLRIPFRKVGGRVYYTESALRAFVEGAPEQRA